MPSEKQFNIRSKLIATRNVKEYRETIPVWVSEDDVVLEIGCEWGTTSVLINNQQWAKDTVATEARLAELDGANLPADIAALPTAAEVNAEVVDAISTDTYPEPGQGAPPATASLVGKVGTLHKNLRNKKTTTATQESLFNDDAATVDSKSALSDAGGTFTKGEMETGP